MADSWWNTGDLSFRKIELAAMGRDGCRLDHDCEVWIDQAPSPGRFINICHYVEGTKRMCPTLVQTVVLIAIVP